MINIVIINGSPRKNGSTANLLTKMADFLNSQKDTNVTYINLIDYGTKFCNGCMKCYQNGICTLPDRLEEVVRLVLESDSVIIGSPTYASNVSGLLKTFIDRGHFVLEQALKGKYTFALVTYEIAGGKSVLSILKSLFLYSGGILSGEFICKLPYNTSPFDVDNMENKLLYKTEKLYKAIKIKKSRSLLHIIINHIAFHYIMKPQVLKRPQQYQAVITRWKKYGIVK